MEAAFLAVLGRILVGLFFVWAGVSYARAWQRTVETMRSQQVFLPTVALWLGVVIQIVAGVMVILGWELRVGVGLLILMLLIISGVAHRFWNMQGEERRLHGLQMMNNLALIGALLMALYATRH